MTRAGETPIVVPHDWGLSVVFGQIKNAPAAPSFAIGRPKFESCVLVRGQSAKPVSPWN
jgi:hypothetical protein